MESRQFIKTSQALVTRIKDFALLVAIGTHDQSEGESIQKAVNGAFSGLQNPTLPSAYKLRDAALDNDFYVDPRVQHRITQAEGCWQ